MAAGLPGFGLSGVFFVISALFMVPFEVVVTLRGRSSFARWRGVLRNAGLALAILAGLELTYAALHFAVTQLSGSASDAHSSQASHGGRTVDVVHAIPVLPILGTLGLVAIVIACAKAAEILSDRRGAPVRSGASATPRPDLPHDHVQPHEVDHERFVNEFQRPLGLASGTSR